MNEEILVRLGIDGTAMAAGLRSAKAKLHEFSESVGEGFKDVFKDLFPLASIGGALLTIEKAFNKVETIKRQAESLGVSTGFAQDITNIAALSGIGAEKVEKFFAAFAKGLGPGKDIEEEFYKLADSIHDVEDPLSRVAMLGDAGAKGGVKMIAVLQQGSEELRKLGSQISKFSSDDIRELDKAKEGFERFGNAIVIGVGKAVIGWAGAFDILKRTLANGGNFIAAFGGFKGGQEADRLAAKEEADRAKKAQAIAAQEEAYREDIKSLEKIKDAQEKADYAKLDNAKKIEFLQKHQADALASAKHAGEKGDEKARTEWIIKAFDYEDKILEVNKKITEEKEKQAKAQERLRQRTQDAAVKWIHAEQALDTANIHTAGFNLEELSQATFSGRHGRQFATGEAQDAKTVIQLREWAKWNALHGNIDKALWQVGRADEIFSGLSKGNPFLEDPMAHLREEAEKSAASLKKLEDLASGTGLRVEIEMGD